MQANEDISASALWSYSSVYTHRKMGGGRSFRLQQRSPSVPAGLYIASLYTRYKGAKVYLYESHVWLGLITYGGIILSFIKRVGAESRGV